MPFGLECWLGECWAGVFWQKAFTVPATCLQQGTSCEPPASYAGPCGSMSFKALAQSQLEDAILKCRSCLRVFSCEAVVCSSASSL